MGYFRVKHVKTVLFEVGYDPGEETLLKLGSFSLVNANLGHFIGDCGGLEGLDSFQVQVSHQRICL